MTRPIDVRLFISWSQRALQVMELVRPCSTRARNGFYHQAVGPLHGCLSRLHLQLGKQWGRSPDFGTGG